MRYSRFTLVELLAAMAILVLVGSASAAALYSFHRNHLKVSKISDRLERNRKIDKVAELMGNMIPFEWQSDNEDGRTLVFEGAPDELFFTAMRLPDNQGRGAIIFVRLYVDEEKRLMCDYSNTPMLPWDEDSDNPAGMKSTVIAENVIDGTGHPSEILNLAVKKAKIQLATPTGDIIGEKPMWVENGEASTVENTREYYPGLYACGMSANNVMGGYRMGPIFGGMLMSGRKAAKLIIEKGR